MMEYLDWLAIGIKIRMQVMADTICEKLKEEAGDTNLISIIIVLGIVLALVVVFRKYIQDILDKIKGSVANFSNGDFNSGP